MKPPKISRETADPELFKAVAGRLASGIVVITSLSDGEPVGMTATAVCSLSLQPQLILACFDNGSRTLKAVKEHGHFGINLLSSDQREISQRFASKDSKSNLFQDLDYTVVEGSPILTRSLAWFSCNCRELTVAGDHTVGIGEVLALNHQPDRQPLIWFNGQYLPTEAAT